MTNDQLVQLAMGPFAVGLGAAFSFALLALVVSKAIRVALGALTGGQ